MLLLGLSAMSQSCNSLSSEIRSFSASLASATQLCRKNRAYKRGGCIKFLPRGVRNIHPPPPSPSKMPSGQNRGRGGVYHFSLENRNTWKHTESHGIRFGASLIVVSWLSSLLRRVVSGGEVAPPPQKKKLNERLLCIPLCLNRRREQPSS